MTTTAQQTPPNPAQDFADATLAETNNGRDLIDVLHKISQGGYRANPNDRITAANVLMDHGLGKCPKQSPASDTDNQTDDTDNQTDDTDVGAIHESPQTATPEPDSPRLVTQIKHTLNDTLGPPPAAPTNHDQLSTIHHPLTTIQKYILKITDNGQTLRDTLEDIARAPDEDTAITAYHRTRAARSLLDRILGTGRALTRPEPAEKKPYRRPVKYLDPVKLAAARAEVQRMKDEGELNPDPNRPKIDISKYMPPDDFDLTPYAKEEAAKFWEEINLRYERQKQWPEIEERRRRKHKEIYPSHSDDQEDDDKPPDP